MFFKRFYDDNLAQASYMIACEKTREAIIVDPNLDVAQYTRAAGAQRAAVRSRPARGPWIRPWPVRAERLPAVAPSLAEPGRWRAQDRWVEPEPVAEARSAPARSGVAREPRDRPKDARHGRALRRRPGHGQCSCGRSVPRERPDHDAVQEICGVAP